MVYGVLILNVNPADSAGIVFSTFFGNDFVRNDGYLSHPRGQQATRTPRHKRLAQVKRLQCCMLLKECSLKRFQSDLY